MIKQRFLLYLLLCTCCTIQAQEFSRVDVPFTVNGQELPNPLTGGINTPQLSAIDLNNDNIQDLFVFDRVGNVILTFLNNGTEYTFAPEYINNFPVLTDWVLLRDYNGDGIQDIFAYSDVPGIGGVIVYKGYYENNAIAFERFNFPNVVNLIFFPLPAGGETQLFISDIDYPAVDDIDCDGDLDILTFGISGSTMEFYKNQSVEMGYGLDSLIFQIEESCWGGFVESGFSSEITLSDTPGQCADDFAGEDEVDFRHAGSTILTFDSNNDQLIDVVIGDLVSQTVAFLTNAGTCEEAWMNTQTTVFPVADTAEAIDIPLFPAAFYLDVTNDGINDILAAPNPDKGAENVEMLWLYENVGTNELPAFEFVEKDFLVDGMLDFGSGARPAFVDYNADGLMDLVVGNFTYYIPFGEFDSRLLLFENTGTIGSPEFELVDDDYLGLSLFSNTAYRFSPEFGDLDGDGDQDILVGEEFGNLFYAENIAGAGNPMEFGSWQYGYMGIDVGLVSTPEIVDLDRDGLLDLLVGERSGNINFFKNIGTSTAPMFNPDQEMAPNTFFIGQIDTRIPGFITGHSSPTVVEIEDEYHLITGTEIGRLEAYTNIDNNLYGAYDLVNETYGEVAEGTITNLDFADINNNGLLDMIVGNLRGGLALYETDIPVDVVSSTELVQKLKVRIFPNPARDLFQIQSTGEGEAMKIQILDMTGRLIQEQRSNETLSTVDVSNLPNGIYLVKVFVGNASTVEKLVVD